MHDPFTKAERTYHAVTVGLIVLVLALFTLALAARGDVLGLWFSPGGGCTAAIVAEIDKAKQSIDYRMYNFTSEPIGDALIRAHKRKVKVTLLLDDDEADKQWSQAKRCAAAGIPVYLDGKHAIAHNKARIFDGKRVMFGSFNDSRSAERSNSEELVLEDDQAVVAKFAANFREHLKHSTRLEAGR